VSRDDRGDPLDAALRALGRDLAPSLRCGPFVLVQQIDAGAAGEVFAASRDGDGGAVRHAVKVVRDVGGGETLRRFERERVILRRLRHPGIVEVVDDGALPDGSIWFAMPFIDGGPIDAVCDERRLGVAARIELLARACDAVAAAHAVKVIHRDLKPANILARPEGGSLAPCIIDFGIARALLDGQPRLTPADVAHRLGTPEFMPPEQWEFGVGICDERSDVFALGMVLGALCAGVLPRRKPAAASRSRRARPPVGVPCPPSAALADLAAREPGRAETIATARRMASAAELVALLRVRVDPIFARATAEAPENRLDGASALAAAMRAG